MVANLHQVAQPFASDAAMVEAVRTLTSVAESEMSIDQATSNEIVDQVYELLDAVVICWLIIQ